MVQKARSARVLDWGLIPYEEAAARQEAIFKAMTTYKKEHPKESTPEDYFIFCSHPPVFTLGRAGDTAHLLIPEALLQKENIAFYESSRGGDITYHGPGQIVLYPLLDLEAYRKDIRWYVWSLEEAVIRSLATFSLPATRLAKHTGVWIDAHDDNLARKICAIGVRCGRWVTMHGLALNVYTDLTHFDYIVPCGIPDKKVSSLCLELGDTCPDISIVKTELLGNLQAVLGEGKV